MIKQTEPEVRMALLGDDRKPREVFEAGESLALTAAGLRPATTYEIAVKAGGKDLFVSRLMTDSRGGIEPTVLWPQIGMEDEDREGTLTYLEAFRRWAGKTVEVSIRSAKKIVISSGAAFPEKFGRPLVMSTDRDGRLLNGFEHGPRFADDRREFAEGSAS